LYAFEIISPEYWRSEIDSEDFEISLALLVKEFGVSKRTSGGSCVAALISPERLHEQMER
jgi:hypothetical protein